jgi:hypothetical protein
MYFQGWTSVNLISNDFGAHLSTFVGVQNISLGAVKSFLAVN